MLFLNGFQEFGHLTAFTIRTSDLHTCVTLYALKTLVVIKNKSCFVVLDDDFDGLPAGGSVSRCTAVYEFIGNGPGELTIRPGRLLYKFRNFNYTNNRDCSSFNVGSFPLSHLQNVENLISIAANFVLMFHCF